MALDPYTSVCVLNGVLVIVVFQWCFESVYTGEYSDRFSKTGGTKNELTWLF